MTLVKVPHAAPAHPGPVALHITPLFVVSPARMAVNRKVCPWSMLGGLEGAMVTPMSVDGGAPPQPLINNRIESASASFFIIYAISLP